MKNFTTNNYYTFIMLTISLLYLSVSSLSLSSDTHFLLAFKSSLPSPNPLQNWLPSLSPCNFTGILCSDQNQNRVSSVNLDSIPLNADFESLSSTLFSLPNILSISLKNTNLTGSVSSLSKTQCSPVLSSVDLAENELSGPISDLSSFGSCSELKTLNLSANLFDFSTDSGTNLSNLKNLEVFDLSYNKINGEKVIESLLSGGCGSLTSLSLKGNKISGEIPVKSCERLELLDLSANNFSSIFPNLGQCSVLTHLDLSSNKLSGDPSLSLSSCKSLKFLNLTKNNLSGEVPTINSPIQYLHLSGNNFHGEIPATLSDLGCSELVDLDLSGNQLSGIVPQSLSSCSVLESLDLTNNNFSGELPIDIVTKLGNLKNLALGFNKFSGNLPETLSNLTNLETLDLSSNSLFGTIPKTLCENPENKLRVLYLQNNMLNGPIPESLSSCINLESLDLSFNYLNGTIPSTLGSLSSLRDLMMWLNELEGEIPIELSKIETLENLILDFNELSGTIPSSLSKCTNLNWISLSNNKLSGSIPASFGNLTNLAILKLGNNSISGQIPSELGDCSSLVWLDLNTNFLNGSIPPDLFKQSGRISLRLLTGKQYVYIKNDGSKQCHGAGNLLEFGGIRQNNLNRISTRHPCNFTRVYRGITAPTFNHNGSMILLDLSNNLLEGNIPKEIGSMYYLNVLNFGHNNLSGVIPQELGTMKMLAILDISYNRLSGTIPHTMSGLAMLGEFDISNNNLSGLIPQTAPFDTFPDYKFFNNSGLCGYPLPVCGSDSSANLNNRHQKSHRKASIAGSVAMGLLFSLFCIIGVVIILIESKKRRKKKEAALEAYIEGHSRSGTANSAWKLTSVREALSINLSTFEKPLRKLTFADLLEATNGFHTNSLVGSGGFGDVYKAKLKDGSVVAIKKLIQISGQGDREFMAEMETIGKVKHRNLVPLLGYCKVGEERLLVYEYMKHGSLEDVLHDKKKTGIRLNWISRRKIAIGAARGLAFLHHNCIPHIIHRDMKSSNVLLDDNLEARVSDFGMAREMNAVDTHLSVSTLAGTPGYVPPEYYQSFRCSTKGDVYSYGVVLLELLTGKRPTENEEFGENNLVGWVKMHAKLRISDVFDSELLKEDKSLEIELLQHLKVACACLDDRPFRRPTMIQVMAMFKEIQTGSSIDSGSENVGFCAIGEGIELTIKEGNENGKV